MLSYQCMCCILANFMMERNLVSFGDAGLPGTHLIFGLQSLCVCWTLSKQQVHLLGEHRNDDTNTVIACTVR